MGHVDQAEHDEAHRHQHEGNERRQHEGNERRGVYNAQLPLAIDAAIAKGLAQPTRSSLNAPSARRTRTPLAVS